MSQTEFFADRKLMLNRSSANISRLQNTGLNLSAENLTQQALRKIPINPKKFNKFKTQNTTPELQQQNAGVTNV